jgi:uncharacterized protein
MATDEPITIHDIFRYPVKGMTGERLDRAELLPGQAIANDRRFALALSSTRAGAAATEWMPKSNFLMLMRDERLASIETRFDDVTDTLTVFRNDRQVAKGKLTDAVGRATIEEFYGAFMGKESGGRPKVIEGAGGHVLSDHASPVLSIINLASVKDLERVTQKPVDPRRFRGNILIDGLAPWQEFDWIEKSISIGDVRCTVTGRIDRCAATNVNPNTAERDMNIVMSLKRGFDHIDMGVFVRIETAGTIETGARLTLPA